MRYEYISENIIICENYLPEHMIQKINIDLLNNRMNFTSSKWDHYPDNKNAVNRDEFYSSNCGGFDYWIKEDEIIPNNEAIIGLKDWFYHQGILKFIENQGRTNVFHFLKKMKGHKIHVMAYNNQGYYNWHTDSEFFTFNLVLNQSDALSGGDMLFMDEGRIIEIPNKNNLMVLFPSYINHSITPLKSKDDKDVPFPQQRFSIQYWVKCN